MRLLALAITLIALTACAGQPQPPGSTGPDYGSMTLDVENRSGGQLRVYANGRPVGSVDQANSCVVIPANVTGQGQVRLAIKATAEDRFYLPSVDPYQIEGWTVVVQPWPNTRGIQSVTMRPAARCD